MEERKVYSVEEKEPIVGTLDSKNYLKTKMLLILRCIDESPALMK